MMKYAVIGAGVSGLSMAGMLLKKGHEVVERLALSSILRAICSS